MIIQSIERTLMVYLLKALGGVVILSKERMTKMKKNLKRRTCMKYPGPNVAGISLIVV